MKYTFPQTDFYLSDTEKNKNFFKPFFLKSIFLLVYSQAEYFSKTFKNRYKIEIFTNEDTEYYTYKEIRRILTHNYGRNTDSKNKKAIINLRFQFGNNKNILINEENIKTMIDYYIDRFETHKNIEKTKKHADTI